MFCGAPTRRGALCTRRVTNGQRHCHLHHMHQENLHLQTLETVLQFGREHWLWGGIGYRNGTSPFIAIFADMADMPALQERYREKTHFGAFFIDGMDFAGASTLIEIEDQLRSLDVHWKILMNAHGNCSHVEEEQKQNIPSALTDSINFTLRQLENIRMARAV